MAGNILAFRRYVPGKGMFGTQWTTRYVERFLKDPVFWKAFKNTIVLSLSNLIVNFPIPIIFAIALNELRWEPFKKFAQTASYIPRFVSTVVVIAILNEFLSPSSGFLNMLLKEFGLEGKYCHIVNGHVPVKAKKGKKKLSKQEKENLISQYTSLMREAARVLDFEQAAYFRARFAELKE